jgi:hypothetical protein
MKLTKALNYKNKLVTKLNNAWAKLQKYNSTVEGTKVPYSAEKLMSEVEVAQEELIRLKVALHKASEPVRDKIFLLSELKTAAKKLASLSTVNGPVVDHYSRRETPTVYVAIIDEVKQEELVAAKEKEIEKLQEELDQFNYNTEVTW